MEHIEDDRSFLKALKAKIGEKGRVYLTVPAYSGLWSQEDGRAGHYRRYSLGQICKLLEESGFRVEYSSYFFFLSFYCRCFWPGPCLFDWASIWIGVLKKKK